MQSLSSKKYKNKFVSHFPGDNSGNLLSRQTPGSLYSKAFPSPVKQPKLLAWSEELAAELSVKKPLGEDIQILAGNKITESMKPYAACYGGHQFGNWAGQLGDGRAITLGEWETQKGKWELQLKGAGPTAYSRSADGRAVLRSSVREFLISEGMFHLGVPTTRALSLVSTGEKILRDMFYDGHPEYEPGAIVMRVAPSFLRFGNFEILAARNETGLLKRLVDWTVEQYEPQFLGKTKIVDWFREVVRKTAFLMTEWHRVGFVHGVMNTDNMSVLGLSLDYGPFSFLDDYNPNFTPNTTDLPGRRYAFGNQPSVAYWNLGKFAAALLPLVENTNELEETLHEYEATFWEYYYEMMGNKLGLDSVKKEDAPLISDFEKVLSETKPDMTIFYRLLIDVPLELQSEHEAMDFFKECFYELPQGDEKTRFIDLVRKYSKRIEKNRIPRKTSREMMKKNNPYFILRNYLLHQAIEELEKGENQLFKKLQQAMKTPYMENFPEFFAKRPDWAEKKAGCSMLSCSS